MKEKYKVLDKGFVYLVDSMGGDSGVVQSARVSYGSGLKGDEQDKKLVNYLLKHQHMTPFESSVIKFHVKAPIFVVRQWFRHRWGAFNEISGRYTEFPADEFYIPERVRVPDKKNKQKSVFAEIDEEGHDKFAKTIELSSSISMVTYKKLIAAGVSRELARIILPLNMYTEFYWTVHARALMNFLQLRLGEGSQFEITEFAKGISNIFALDMPWTHEAFSKHVLS